MTKYLAPDSTNCTCMFENLLSYGVINGDDANAGTKACYVTTYMILYDGDGNIVGKRIWPHQEISVDAGA